MFFVTILQQILFLENKVLEVICVLSCAVFNCAAYLVLLIRSIIKNDLELETGLIHRVFPCSLTVFNITVKYIR